MVRLTHGHTISVATRGGKMSILDNGEILIQLVSFTTLAHILGGGKWAVHGSHVY